MNIRQLEYFVAVSEVLNFTNAAKQFYISQTAVTQQIKALENEIGVKLFNRNNRNVELTPAGKIFLDDAKAIIRRTEDAVERAKKADTIFTGHINIGFVKGYEKTNLSDILSDFYIKYPNISFKFFRENMADLYDGILDNTLDVVINIIFTKDDLQDVETHVVCQYPLIAVLPNSHPLAHRSMIKRSDLKGYPLVDIKISESRYGETKTILNAFTKAGFMPNVNYVSDDIETSILAVSAGFGYALLPAYITDALSARENVVTVPIEGEEKQITIVAAWHKNNKNPALEKFLQHCLNPDLKLNF